MAPATKKRKYSTSQASQMPWGLYKPARKTAGLAKLKSIADKLGVESKYLDTTFTSVDISTTWSTPACLNLVGIGDLPTERVGKKYHIHSLQLHGRITSTGETDLAEPYIPPVVRVIVFQDKQTNGALATGLQVMDTDVVESLRNAEYESRFKCLMDKKFCLDGSIISTDGANTCAQRCIPQVFDFYTKLSIDVTTIDGDADIAAIVDNSIHVITIASTSSLDARYHMHARIRFVG